MGGTPDRSFGAQCSELLGSFFAFDGRVWRSMWPLFFKPGRLTRAWIEGKRASFVPPLRLLLFFSILLFLVVQCKTPTTDLLTVRDPASPAGATEIGPVTVQPEQEGDFQFDMDLPGFWPFSRLKEMMQEQERKFQKIAPEARQYILARRALELAPVALLMLLPIMAIFLKLWWMRTGSFYLDHLVLLMHAYAFICGLAVFLTLVPLPNLVIVLAPCILIPVYFHVAMRRVYQRGFWRTFFGTFAGGVVTVGAAILVLMILVPYGMLTV